MASLATAALLAAALSGPTVPAEPAGQPAPAGVRADAFAALIREILLATLPRTGDERQNWGKQVTRKEPALNRRGLRMIDRDVNHGLWKSFSFALAEPEKRLTVAIEDWSAPPGKATTFRLTLRAPLSAKVEAQQWIYGVRAFQIAGAANTAVEVACDCRCETAIVARSLLPELVIRPRLDAVRVRLRDFRLERLGVIDGKLARELSDDLERLLNRRLAKEEGRILAKANEALAKKGAGGTYSLSLWRLAGR